MPEATGSINRSNTICHYTRFFRFLESNCNGCNVGDPKMVELLHLFAENGLGINDTKKTPQIGFIGWGHRLACPARRIKEFPTRHSGQPSTWPRELCRTREPCSTCRMDSFDGFIGTFSGLRFWPLDPNPEKILIDDIAHALAHQCRFGGHASRFYSVAEHSVHVSRLCPPEDALWGLLHDASEAYLVDLPRPLKQLPE